MKIFPASHILTATVTFTSGTGTLPTRFGTLYGDPYRNEGEYFPELSIDDFVKTSGNAVTIEGATIKVKPTSVGSLTVRYYPTFPEISGGVNPTIHAYLHEPIIYGIIFRAYEDLQDESLSKYYKEKYDNDLAERIAVLSNYEEGNQRAGQLFAEQNLLDFGSPVQDPNFF